MYFVHQGSFLFQMVFNATSSLNLEPTAAFPWEFYGHMYSGRYVLKCRGNMMLVPCYDPFKAV